MTDDKTPSLTGPAQLPEATRKAMGATPKFAKVEARALTFDEWYKSQWPLSFQAVKEDKADEDTWDAYRLAEHAWHTALSAPPAASAQKGLSDAARDVFAERQRQVEKEGWTPEHDDGANDVAAMADAAACYAMHAGQVLAQAYSTRCLKPHPLWPWDARWWKPTTPRRDLVKAGALVLAEIERIDRALLRESEGK